MFSDKEWASTREGRGLNRIQVRSDEGLHGRDVGEG